MAMTTALAPSPSIKSAFSPYTDSPASPAPLSVVYRAMQRQSAPPDSLVPKPPLSPYPATVDPSPVESHNSASTEATDIEVDDRHLHVDDVKSPDIEVLSPAALEQLPPADPPQPTFSPAPLSGKAALNALSRRVRIDTAPATIALAGPDEAPQSVIHAPKGFKDFAIPYSSRDDDALRDRPADVRRSPPHARRRSNSDPSKASSSTAAVAAPEVPAVTQEPDPSDTTPMHINTEVPPSRQGAGGTPRASTQEEADAEWKRRPTRNPSGQGLDDVTEDDLANAHENPAEEVLSMSTALRNLNNAEQEISSLKAALSECWNLCNTLANLSASHRERMFSFIGTGEMQEQAWKSCWRLCQKLYESRDEDHASQVKPTLELCREFCQALFEARDRGDEVVDSILRVSFELNNHLYNTQNPGLPDVFTERTLDFYLTLCHRLMKGRTSLPEETDQLLRACWNLAECLFSLRQKTREQQPVDEELLSSAVNACWELCDLFREGWSAVRPERGTPRPEQRFFSPHVSASSTYAASHGSNSRPPSSLSLESNFRNAQERLIRATTQIPETPTTIFDDDSVAYGQEIGHKPNIMMLGAEHAPPTAPRNTPQGPRWGTTPSVSSYSGTTNSSRTAQPQAVEANDDANLTRIKALILKAALNKGYARNAGPAGANGTGAQKPGGQQHPSLAAFVRALPPTAFGSLPWQMTVFESYRRLVLTDPALRDANGFPRGRRFSPGEIAMAVKWIGNNDGFKWLDLLYHWVFGYPAEEGTRRKAGTILV